ncbi:uncharacterized protein LOC143543040 [Bidens hawaiensis]|uniref:uncharacterized protein LOC143543040 n=1 Tax=Bidens hawaiensis TaxID=980011 RepID=UPI00404B6B73
MNNGGGGDSSRGTEFAQALVRIAVAQICETVGLQGFQQSALEALSDIACKYIQDIGRLSNFYASLAGRTESSVFDIVHGLEDLGLSQGFIGGSDLDHCLSESGIIKEITRYIGESEEVGFAYTVPFPVVKEREAKPSFFHSAESPPVDNNNPPWLPCFPYPETYTSLSSGSIEQTETKEAKVDQDPKRNNGKEQVNNPFLVSAFEYGNKKVSLVSLPARFVEEDVARNHSLWAEHVSSLSTFGRVVKEFESCDLDTYEGSKEIGLEGRPAVRLKFNTRKKSSATGNKHRTIGNTQSMSWFAVDDYDEKTTKEKIEKDSFENISRINHSH